jgi:hypothetical protein
VFPWFSIQHNAQLFEVSENVLTLGAQRTKVSRKNLLNGLSLKHFLWYVDEYIVNWTVAEDKSA